MVKLLIRPAPPTGPGPATTSGHVAARHESQSFRGSHPRSPTHSPSPSGCEGDPHSLTTAIDCQCELPVVLRFVAPAVPQALRVQRRTWLHVGGTHRVSRAGSHPRTDSLRKTPGHSAALVGL